MTENDVILLKMRLRIFVKSWIGLLAGAGILCAIFFFYEREIRVDAETVLTQTRKETEMSEEKPVSILPVSPYVENPTIEQFFSRKKK